MSDHGACRHCCKPTGTYPCRATGRLKHYVSCFECKDLPPPGMKACPMFDGYKKKPCGQAMKVGHASCFPCSQKNWYMTCERCSEQFVGKPWQNCCKKCYKAAKQSTVTLDDLLPAVSEDVRLTTAVPVDVQGSCT